MKSKILFSESSSFGNRLLIPFIFCISYLLSLLILEESIFKDVFSFIVTVIITLLFNKKLFHSIELFIDKGFVFNYPLNFFGDTERIVEFTEVEKIIYFDYMSDTPSHCSVFLNKSKFRIECSKKEAEKLYLFFKDLDIPFQFDGDKEVRYRNEKVFKKKKYD